MKEFPPRCLAWMLAGAALLGCAVFLGCAGSKDQLIRCSQEKEQLTEVIRSQRTANNALQTRYDSLAKRLDEAEKELALSQGRGTRISRSEPAAAPPAGADANRGAPIREPEAAAAPSEEKLPWRPARGSVNVDKR